MIKKIFLLAFITTFTFAQQQKFTAGTPPNQIPVLFAPEVISTGLSERDMAFSPDGREMYYTIQNIKTRQSAIMRRTLQNGKWANPEIASFSGRYADLEPAFSPDGKQLFFASNRPLDDTGDAKDYDIWVVARTTASGWSEPKNIGPMVNTSADEFYPSVTKSGTIYFTATYERGIGKEDIWQCHFVNGQYTKAEVLGEGVNSKGYEFNAFVAPDESYILFTGYGRKDDLGGGDLYISLRNADGTWAAARHLEGGINSSKIDYCPYVTPDGYYFFFTSERPQAKPYADKPLKYNDFLKTLQMPGNGNGDIYWVEMKAVTEKLK